MSTWLITGGAGFIGSNFVRLVGKKPPARLLIFDALTYAGNLAGGSTSNNIRSVCWRCNERHHSRW